MVQRARPRAEAMLRIVEERGWRPMGRSRKSGEGSFARVVADGRQFGIDEGAGF